MISECADNVLLWNAILYCLRTLSKPLIAFEWVHSMDLLAEVGDE